MKNRFTDLLFILLFLSVSIFFACSKDDDSNSSKGDESSMSFSTNDIVGTWDIVEIEGKSPHYWIAVGEKLSFDKDGYCTTGYSMEQAYVIEGGKVKTYCSANAEPMFVYSLISKSDDKMTIRMDGTLDDDSSVTFVVKKLIMSTAEIYYQGVATGIVYNNSCDSIWQNNIVEALNQWEVFNNTFVERDTTYSDNASLAIYKCNVKAVNYYQKLLSKHYLSEIKRSIFNSHADSLVRLGITCYDSIDIHPFTLCSGLFSIYQGSIIYSDSTMIK